MNIYKNFHSPSQEWLLCNISLRHQHMVKQKGDQKNNFQRWCLISLSQNYKKNYKKKTKKTDTDFQGWKENPGARGIIRILSATKGILSVLDMGFQSLEKLCFHNIWTCAFLALLTFEERAFHSMLHKWTVDACHGHLYRFWLATRVYLNQITFSSNSLRARPVALRLCL